MKIGDLGLDDGGEPQLSPLAGCAMVCGLAPSMSITIALHHARFRDQLLRLISCVRKAVSVFSNPEMSLNDGRRI